MPRGGIGLVKAKARLIVVVEPAVSGQHLLGEALLIHRSVDITYDGVLGLSDAELGEVSSEFVVLDVGEELREAVCAHQCAGRGERSRCGDPSLGEEAVEPGNVTRAVDADNAQVRHSGELLQERLPVDLWASLIPEAGDCLGVQAHQPLLGELGEVA